MQQDDAGLARDYFEQLLKRFWDQRYSEYRQGLDPQERFLDEYMIPRETYRLGGPDIPAAVRDAYSFYLGAVEGQDWGVVRLHRVPLDDRQVYAVRVTTDGDDGWLELYDEQGTTLGVGRTYLELVAWGEKDEIRAQTQSGQFPAELSDRDRRTLWGK